ncbi:hypothetical protein HanRHA438_Chr06g0272371 [Helianthus annuus]|nr:hypothetical protein HanRHA438_Chr06g0272371 [Helianthus annuus]
MCSDPGYSGGNWLWTRLLHSFCDSSTKGLFEYWFSCCNKMYVISFRGGVCMLRIMFISGGSTFQRHKAIGLTPRHDTRRQEND